MSRVAREEPQGLIREALVARYVLLSPSRAFIRNQSAQFVGTELTTPTEALEAQTSTLSLDAQKRAAKDAAKKASKAEAAEAKNAASMSASKVTIKRIERNKRKYVTSVSGLEPFGLELKKVSKEFGKKFATGSSVTKTASGGEEIIVQGDVSEEIEEFLQDKWPGVVPEDNVELVEDKKKKASS